MSVSLEEWKMFKESSAYIELEEEWTERRQILLVDLETGNHEFGNDDKLRGRLNELEFVRKSIRDRVELLELEQEALKKAQEQE